MKKIALSLAILVSFSGSSFCSNDAVNAHSYDKHYKAGAIIAVSSLVAAGILFPKTTVVATEVLSIALLDAVLLCAVKMAISEDKNTVFAKTAYSSVLLGLAGFLTFYGVKAIKSECSQSGLTEEGVKFLSEAIKVLFQEVLTRTSKS